MAGITDIGVGGLIGLQAGSSVLNTGLGLIGQSINYRQQRKLADLQYSRSLEIMNRQNAYNSPAAQVSRLRAAGLNPNLLYGNGSTATGNTDVSTPVYNPPAPSFRTDTNMNLANAFSQYQQIASWQAQEESYRAQAAVAKAQARNIDVDTAGKILANTRTEAERPYWNIWFGNRATREGYELHKLGNEARASDVLPAQREADLRETNARIAGIKLDNSIKDFRFSLEKKGVNPNATNVLSTLMRIGLASVDSRKELEQVIGRIIDVGVSSLGIAAKKLRDSVSDVITDFVDETPGYSAASGDFRPLWMRIVNPRDGFLNPGRRWSRFHPDRRLNW